MSTRSIRKASAVTALVASGLVAGGVLAGSMTANAATATPGYGVTGSAPQGGGQHTAATTAEADKVKAAVKAKDSTVTITTVQKDADGSFDALGTDASGNKVAYDVSADYKTVTARTGGGKGGPGGRGGGQHTAATTAEADKVKAAVKAKDSTVTITTVQKDADGSFDALGTDASGNKVFYDVSADYATVTKRTAPADGGKGGPRGGGGQHTAATAAETASVKAAVKAKDSTVTITEVRKDADGSFDAMGTDASGNKVFYDVSSDYKTVTAHTGGGPKGGAPAPSSSTSPSA